MTDEKTPDDAHWVPPTLAEDAPDLAPPERRIAAAVARMSDDLEPPPAWQASIWAQIDAQIDAQGILAEELTGALETAGIHLPDADVVALAATVVARIAATLASRRIEESSTDVADTGSLGPD